ncbi:MAG TPA: penicillin-binding transpeptidase domain-containing protein [Gammaproteobacteria bacterium]|nr:penicillin-binding transpeptidase domain-containing protein [Gammaproteobacteria bacterium]
MSSKRKSGPISRRWRSILLLAGLALGGGALEARVLYLQLVDQDFLVAQGDDRYLRTVTISAHRGSVTDRNGEPLAVSTPVDSIWANPQELKPALDKLGELAAALGVDRDGLARRITSNMDREFVYLQRDLPPEKAAQVLSLNLPGVRTQREYRRYYPAGEVAGHVIGFTNVDDAGQEGLELEFDYWLKGQSGSKQVLQDRLGHVVGDVRLVDEPRPGRELRTSIDLRLQYLAYRELKAAVIRNKARSGSLVILDPRTGEVLAMVNQPSFNPNDRSQLDPAHYRNRAVTDIFEPGSSLKTFTLAAAIDGGFDTPSSIIDTSPGYLKVGRQIVTRDHHDLGPVTLTTILAKSSNVGAGTIALQMQPNYMWSILSGFGIGQLTESGFPGESAGVLHDPQYWRPVEQATMAYGYGVSVTTLQLARAYAAVADGGVLRPVSFLPVDKPPKGKRVISEQTAAGVLHMMEAVVSPEGTGEQADVANYRIAGKTGTAWEAVPGGYSTDRYTSVFAGIAPVSHPRLVVVVVIMDPQGKYYYGGEVSAPVFADVMKGALRLLAVPPDALPVPPVTVVARAEVDR